MDIRTHWVFEDCDLKIYDMCIARLKEEYEKLDKEGREKAESRFRRELDIVKRNGFSCEFYIRKLILEYAESMRRIAIVRGMAAYSYISYLLGITDINPVSADYPEEMAFSFRYNRCPYMPIYVPEDFNIDIEEDYLPPLLGERFVRKEGSYTILGDETKQDKNYYAHTVQVPVIADELLTMTNGAIVRRCDGDSQKAFAEEKKRIYTPLISMSQIPDDIKKRWVRKHILDYIVYHNDVDNEIKQNPNAFIKEIFDGSYESVIRLVAALYGSEVWISEEGNTGNDIFYTRDDVYRYGLRLFGGRVELAYELMDKVRKGRGDTEKVQNLLDEYGANTEIKERLKRIKYLVSEGECVQIVRLMDYIGNAIYDNWKLRRGLT